MRLSEYVDNQLKSGKDISSALKSISGLTIRPPTGEEHLYYPKELEIKGIRRGKTGMIVLTSSPLHKNQGLVFSKGFYINTKDKDSIWNKFEVVDTDSNDTLHGVPINVVAAMNGLRNATHCYACKKPLIAVFGTMRQCPDCKT